MAKKLDPKNIYGNINTDVLDWGVTFRRITRHPLDESSVQISYELLETEMSSELSSIYDGQIVSILKDDPNHISYGNAPYYIKNEIGDAISYYADRIFTNSYFNEVEAAYYVNRYQLGTYYTGVGSWSNLTYAKNPDGTDNIHVVTGNTYAEIFNDYVNNVALGNYSHVEGSNNKASETAVSSHVGGDSNVVNASTSTVNGSNNTVDGTNNNVSGNKNTTDSNNSIVAGNNNTNNADNVLVLGNKNTVDDTASNSFIGGTENNVSGDNSIINGVSNTSTGDNSLLVGQGSTNVADNSIITGVENKNYGQNSILAGNNVTNHGKNAITNGEYTYNKGNNSFVTGINSYNGDGANNTIVIGDSAYNMGSNSIVGGISNHSYSDNSVVFGTDNTSYKPNTLVAGVGNISYNENETVLGSYSLTNDVNSLFTVGNGTSATDRHNAFEIQNDGTTYINGNGFTYVYEYDKYGNPIPGSGKPSLIINHSYFSQYGVAVDQLGTYYTGVGKFWYDAVNDTYSNRIGTYGEIFNDYTYNRASGNYSHAEGYHSYAIGHYTHVEGKNNIVAGDVSHAEGSNNVIDEMALNSHAEGVNNSIYSSNAHVEGSINNVSGENAHAEGINNETTSNNSHVEGSTNIINQNSENAHAEGSNNKVNEESENAHVEGCNNTVEGHDAHAEGHYNNSMNFATHAEGAYNTAEGIISHAEGSYNLASGNYSHVEGLYNKTTGLSSHAEGTLTYILSDYSHAEGLANKLYENSNYSHAEGSYISIFNSTASHAEGLANQLTDSNYSHAEGSYNTLFKVTYGHIEGNNNLMSIADLSHVEGDHNNLYSTQSSHIEGAEHTLTQSNYIHAEGKNNTVTESTGSHVEGLNHTLETADYSHAEGKDNTITSDYAHAEGNQNTVNGNYSHAEGNQNTVNSQYSHIEGQGGIIERGSNNSHVEGNGNIINASSANSHAEGNQNTINAGSSNSHVEGNANEVNGHFSHIEGDHNRSTGVNNHIEGGYNVVNSSYVHVEGTNNTNTNSTYSHSSGWKTVIENSPNAVVEGIATKASNAEGGHAEGAMSYVLASYSHAEGLRTSASGTASHTEGRNTKATANYSHAEGYYSEARGTGSHAEGNLTKASENYSHAEGSNTNAVGVASHVEGNYSIAKGDYSHAGGTYTYAGGIGSETIGEYTTAYNTYEFAIGSWNRSYTPENDLIHRTKYTHEYVNGAYVSNGIWPEFTEAGGGGTVFTIGDGTGNNPEESGATTYRHNILEVHKNGEWIKNGNSYFANDIFGPVSYTYVESLGISAYLTTILSALLSNPKYYPPVVGMRMNGISTSTYYTSSQTQAVEFGQTITPQISFRAAYVAPNISDYDPIYHNWLGNRLGYSEGVTKVTYKYHTANAAPTSISENTYVPGSQGNPSATNNVGDTYTCTGTKGLTYMFLQKSTDDDKGIFSGALFTVDSTGLQKLTYKSGSITAGTVSNYWTYRDSVLITLPSVTFGTENTYTIAQMTAYDYTGSTQMYFQQLAEKSTYVTNSGLPPTDKFNDTSYVSGNPITWYATARFKFYYGFGNTVPTASWTKTQLTATGTTNKAVASGWLDSNNNDHSTQNKQYNATQSTNSSQKVYWFAIPSDGVTTTKLEESTTDATILANMSTANCVCRIVKNSTADSAGGRYVYYTTSAGTGVLDTGTDEGSMPLKKVTTSANIGTYGVKYDIYYITGSASIPTGTVGFSFKRLR